MTIYLLIHVLGFGMRFIDEFVVKFLEMWRYTQNRVLVFMVCLCYKIKMSNLREFLAPTGEL